MSFRLRNVVLTAALAVVAAGPVAHAQATEKCYGVAPAGQNAMASSVVVVGVGLIGGSLGPVLAGWLSDMLTPLYGNDAMRVALSFGAVPVLIAGLMMLVAARRVDRDLAQCEST